MTDKIESRRGGSESMGMYTAYMVGYRLKNRQGKFVEVQSGWMASRRHAEAQCAEMLLGMRRSAGNAPESFWARVKVAYWLIVGGI